MGSNRHQLFFDLRSEFNQTFVIVTHDRQHFGNVDKVITIKDGKAFQVEEFSTMEITV